MPFNSFYEWENQDLKINYVYNSLQLSTRAVYWNSSLKFPVRYLKFWFCFLDGCFFFYSQTSLYRSLYRQLLTLASYFLFFLLKISRYPHPKGSTYTESFSLYEGFMKKILGAGLKGDSFFFLYSSDIMSSRVQRVNSN